MIELLLGIVGSLIAVVVWLFPPEPLRRVFGIRQVPDAAKAPEPNALRRRCEGFAAFAATFPGLADSARSRILNWVGSLDDEILLIAVAMSGRPEASERVGQSWISEHSHPLGSGRSVPELITALFSAGILAPSTEELVPGSHAEWDAQRNPAFDYGRMLLDTWGILKQAKAAGVFDIHSDLDG